MNPKTFELLFRSAKTEDILTIMAIIEDARCQIALTGSDQWQDGYPNAQSIQEDIERGMGVVLATPTDDVVAYAAMCYEGEEAYRHLEGEWLTLNSKNYVVVHRLAVAQAWQKEGVGGKILETIARNARNRGCTSFRIDTHRKNQAMLHLLQKMGFIVCGKVYYGSGERIALEKLLSQAE